MSFKSKIKLLKSHAIITGAGFFILANMIACAADRQESQNKGNDSLSNRSESNKKFSPNLQACPSTVSLQGKPYGLIELDWSAYAPSINTYFTFLVIPHSGGASKSVTETTDKGSHTLEGYVAGSYYVYFTIYPASSNYPPCKGVQSKLTFT